jgi:integrase
MARKARHSSLETRTARLKLAVDRKPYNGPKLSRGVHLLYRRNKTNGTWVLKASNGHGAYWTKAIAEADDFDESNGEQILTFFEAQDKAKKLARGQDADAGRPATVSEALDDYAADLEVRGAGATNASVPRHHLTPALLSKPVSLLAVKELRAWRNERAKAMPASSVNRMCKSLKAALNLAAAHDDRITNAKAWRVGLAALPEADDTESNLVLSDEQRRDVVSASYAISAELGLYVEVHTTGARSGQIALLDVGDLHAGAEPRLMMPSSLKGKNRKTRTRKPMPITPGLAQRLRAVAAGRDAAEPLLLLDGERWSSAEHRLPFAEAAKAARLPDGASIYCLRHTAITRALLAGVPVRLVASSFDTSVSMVEKTYSKFIADHGDAQMRRALFDIDAPAADNVVPLLAR